MTVPDSSGAWEVLVLDDLEENFLQKTVDFLQGFLAKGADLNWSAEYFRWKLEKNPAGRGFLTCAVSNGNVVGVTSITLKKIWYKNKTITAAEIGDTYTHPSFLKKGRVKRNNMEDSLSINNTKNNYYNKSIFGCLVNETRERALNKGIRIIYGTPNKHSLNGYKKRLNFKEYPLNEIHAFAGPTTTGICSFYGIPGLFYYLMAPVEKILRSISFMYWSTKSRIYGYYFEKVDKPSDDFDLLWGQLKHQYKFSVVHNKEYFQHRYFDHPIGTYNVYKMSCKGEICGIIVTRIFKDFNGRKCCILADWIYDESRTSLFSVMLAYAIQDNKQKDIYYYSTWSGQNRSRAASLLMQGFLKRSACPIIFFRNDEGTDVIENCYQVNVTVASTDNV